MSTFRSAAWILCSIFLGGASSTLGQTKFEERAEFGDYFAKYGVNGSFLLYDMKQDKYIAYDSARCKQRFAPASTFKIFNSLVALETGVAPDEHFALSGMVSKEEGLRATETKTWQQPSKILRYGSTRKSLVALVRSE